MLFDVLMSLKNMSKYLLMVLDGTYIIIVYGLVALLKPQSHGVAIARELRPPSLLQFWLLLVFLL